MSSLLLKFLRASENRSTNRRIRSFQEEARRINEDPTLYLVKQKLKNHPDPKYRQLNREELTREAIYLTDPYSLKEFFSSLTHKPVQDRIEETRYTDDFEHRERNHKKPPEGESHLTLKLHLRHGNDTPSFMVRMGIALLKIPYGVLHASLEIGDTSDPNVSYIIEFNNSSLVQPRKKNHIERSALEATIPLQGLRLLSEPGKVTNQATQSDKKEWSFQSTTIMQLIPAETSSINGEFSSVDTSKPQVNPMSETNTKTGVVVKAPIFSLHSSTNVKQFPLMEASTNKSETDKGTHGATALMPSQSDIKQHPLLESPSLLGRGDPKPMRNVTFESPVRSLPDYHQHHMTEFQSTDRKDLTHSVQISKSKILLIDELVKIIVSYNKYYYYHPITRNCQTFVVEVLQSFGIWENFKLEGRLEQYLENLTKGKKEVYKSHKSVNDRVKYLVTSGEIEETSYDEARYLRSLYTTFHLEDASASATAVCTDQECLLGVIEKRLDATRPEGATV